MKRRVISSPTKSKFRVSLSNHPSVLPSPSSKFTLFHRKIRVRILELHGPAFLEYLEKGAASLRKTRKNYRLLDVLILLAWDRVRAPGWCART